MKTLTWLSGLALILGPVAAGQSEGLTRVDESPTAETATRNVAAAFFRPDLSNPIKSLVSNGTTITVYAGAPSAVPYRLPEREPTVFTVGAESRAPYYYPQALTSTSVQLRAESDYYDLKNSKTVSITATGLSPNTVYFYRVADSREVHRFRTKPASNVLDPVQFVVIGDTQGPYDKAGDRDLNKDEFVMGPFEKENLSENVEFNRIVEAVCEQSVPDLVVHVGDIIEDARYSVQWTREMFSRLRYLLTLAPVYPVMGNHEQHDPRFFRYFDLPVLGSAGESGPRPAFYSFDWGSIHFVILDMSGHWYTIYDIDRVPGERTVSYDIDGIAHRQRPEQVKGGTYTITDEALGLLGEHLSAAQISRLNPLKGKTMAREQFQGRLTDMGFAAGENREIRTAAIDAQARNVATGRVALQVSRGDLGDRQLEWLRRDLEENKDSRYIFAFSHHPQLKAGVPRWEHATLFEQHRVSASFSGHLHVYRHDLRNGVHYFVTGGGSNKAWSRAPEGGPSVRKSKEGDEGSFIIHRYGPQYMIVNVAADCATALGVGLDNTVFDKTIIQPRH